MVNDLHTKHLHLPLEIEANAAEAQYTQGLPLRITAQWPRGDGAIPLFVSYGQDAVVEAPKSGEDEKYSAIGRGIIHNLRAIRDGDGAGRASCNIDIIVPSAYFTISYTPTLPCKLGRRALDDIPLWAINLRLGGNAFTSSSSNLPVISKLPGARSQITATFFNLPLRSSSRNSCLFLAWGVMRLACSESAFQDAVALKGSHQVYHRIK